MKRILVLGLFLVLLSGVALADSGIYIVTGSGEEVPIEYYFSGASNVVSLSTPQIIAVFLGCVVGIIGSTYIPYYIACKRNKREFEYSYLWNAAISGWGTAMTMLVGMPNDTPPWFAFGMALLATSGVKRFGDIQIDSLRKRGGVS